MLLTHAISERPPKSPPLGHGSPGPWWMFLLTGIAWLILSWVALRFTPASVPTVGALLGGILARTILNR